MRGTVVMIHGMWCGSWTWERYASFLEQRGWRCLRPVLRYHDVDPAAQPDPRLGRVSLLDYAADLEAFVRGLGEPGWQEIAAFVAGWLETRTRGRP